MKIGLIAGTGRLPVEISKKIKQQNYELYTCASSKYVDDELKKISDWFKVFNLTDYQEIINCFLENNVKDIVFGGKVNYKVLLNNEKVVKQIPDKRAYSVFRFLASILSNHGINILSVYPFVSHLLPTDMTQPNITEGELNDINIGYKVAKELTKVDVGLTVAVKNGCILAIEAIDGTDAMILRAGKLTRDFIVVKVGREEQDWKFDLPVVGLNTIKNLIKARAKILAIEADKVVALDQPQILNYAEKNSILIYPIKK